MIAPDSPAVVLVTGIQGSGKTTVAALLARRFNRAAHIDGDALLAMVVAGRADPGRPGEGASQLRLRHHQGAWLADSFFAAGFTVVVEDNAYGGSWLDDYVAAVTASPLLVVVLLPGPDVVAAREAQRAKTAYQAGSWGIGELDAALRHDTTRLGLWLDNSEQTPDETVEEILARWDEAIVR
jgi:chloramphenicol 3-O-phosphotransferase